jgi:hypothetical protein
MKKPIRSNFNSGYEYNAAMLEYNATEGNFQDKNTYEKFSAPPELWERLKRYCKSANIRTSHFVQKAITKLLEESDF